MTQLRLSPQNSLCYHQSDRNKNSYKRRENPNEEERLNLFAFPQFHWRFAALNECELHDVEDRHELEYGEHREHGTEGQTNPKDELIEDEPKAGVCDIELREIILVGVRSGIKCLKLSLSVEIN